MILLYISRDLIIVLTAVQVEFLKSGDIFKIQTLGRIRPYGIARHHWGCTQLSIVRCKESLGS